LDADHHKRTDECPICGERKLSVFFETGPVPVFCNVLWETRQDALAAPRAPIRLGFCRACRMIYNMAFDSELVRYSPVYENSLCFSGRFRVYTRQLADALVREHGLYSKNIVEIGCGQGDFLVLLAKLGHNRCVGFDQSFDPSKQATPTHPDVTIVPEPYDEDRIHGAVDVVCCRHVLEHIADPRPFLRSLRRLVGDRAGALLFFEVPNARYILEQTAVWDVIYEHCSFFTPDSLKALFTRSGFAPAGVAERYGGQFLTITAHPQTGGAPACSSAAFGSEGIDVPVRGFEDAHRHKLEWWRERLSHMQHGTARTVVWGAGSKGVMFLNMMDPARRFIQYAVDINPRKQGRYVAGSGHEIIPPGFLANCRPGTVILMNPLYREEVRRSLGDMGLEPEILTA